MNRRRIERVAAIVLSSALLLSSTGILSSFAANVNETSSVVSSSVSSATVTGEGGKISTSSVTAEGGSLSVAPVGEGTKANPYVITNAEEFIEIQQKINLTLNANKYFVLGNDIDLSDVADNSGALITVDKSLASASENVFFNLNGNGHSLKGLKLTVENSKKIALFGYVNAKSVIKNLVVESAKITAKAESVDAIAVLVAENDGTIENVAIKSSKLAFNNASNAGMVVALNNGTVSNVSVKSDVANSDTATRSFNTISGIGSVGAIAGTNNGKITNASALNIGMFIPSESKLNTVYGGIAGTDSGVISNSVSTGAVAGGKSSDVAGGVIGKALKGAIVNNTYTLVKFDKTMYACAVIGMGGKADMLNDCYWSSAISARSVMTSDFGAGVNDISEALYRIVSAGETVTFNPNITWGKASFRLNGNYKMSGDGVSASVKNNNLEIKGVRDGTLNSVAYSVKIDLPATVGMATESVTLDQKMNLPIIVGKGDGTIASPYIVENAKEFSMLANVTGVCAKLGKDIVIDGSAFTFVGTLDGAGHKITTDSQIFSAALGTVKNLKVVLNGEIETALFGKAVNVNANNIDISSLNGSVNVKKNNSGIVFTTLNGKCVIDDVNVVVDTKISENIKNFGAIAGAVNGDGTVISNCGVHTDISLDSSKKAENVAILIGTVSGENVTVKNCCVSGTNKAGAYSLISEITAKDISVSEIYMTKGTQSPVDFAKYQSVKENQFIEWTYGENSIAFFTGNGGNFEIELPNNKQMREAKASDYSVSYDSTKISASVSVNDASLTLKVNKVAGVVTVKASPVTITNKANGLSVTVYVSNGLQKDSNGNCLVTNEFDMAYIGENITELNKASFVVTDDIDMSAITDFSPIGSTVSAFGGKFNANGHTISNLTLTNGAKCGLFGAIDGAQIKNVVIDNAKITSNGAYAAVLVGHSVNSTVENITIKNSSVSSADIYSGILTGFVSGGSIKNIEVINTEIKSSANYVGAVAGMADNGAKISDAVIDKFNVNGAEYVGGVAGLAGEKANIENIKTCDSRLSGTTNVSGIASGNTANSVISDARVENCMILTIGKESAYVAGGISSSFAGTVKNVTVSNTKITSGTVGGIAGKTVSGCSLNISNAEVVSSKIYAKGANTVAAGILATHNLNGSVKIENCTVDKDTVVSSAAVSSGIVGSILGKDSLLTVNSVKSFATVDGCVDANAVSASGIVGVIGVGSINNVQINSVKIVGKIGGAGAVAGAIGIISDTEKFNAEKPLIANSVIGAEITVSDAQSQSRSGAIIGAVESENSLNNKNIDSAISGVIVTTYYPNTTVFGSSTELESSGYYDMDMPNGKAITPSVKVLSSTDSKEVKLSNLPNVDGYSFDASTGWISESEERIVVLNSSEDTVVLKANHFADLGIVGYYVCDSDFDIRIPVHFNMKSDVRTPLTGKGTEKEPYLVTSAYDLETVSMYDSEGKYFALCNDITFTDSDYKFGGAFYNVGNGIMTIGNAENGFRGTFTGLYNGVVHSINDLKISGNTFGGLFGATNGAVISDIIINNADVKGLNYAGVLVGSAKDTVIKNIKINSACVETSELGGVTGGLVGFAENTQISDIDISELNVKTVINSTTATVEVAGGIAGVFDGTISNVKVDNAKVESTYLAGGAVGMNKTEDGVVISNAAVNVNVIAPYAGGVIGKLSNPLNAKISDVLVKGAVNGEKVCAGVIGEIADGYSLSKAEKSLIKNVVVTADVNGNEICGVAVGKASTDTFANEANSKCNVFEDVYYSSAKTTVDAFGNEEINSYQIDEYKVNDLNNIQYVVNGASFGYIPFASAVELGDSLIVSDVDGNYKNFVAGGHEFTLQRVEGNVSYENDTLYLNEKSGGTVVKFIYNDGLELNIGISDNKQDGKEVEVKYSLVDATNGGLLTEKVVGVLIKGKVADSANPLCFYTKMNGEEKKLSAVYTDEGGFYVDMNIPSDYRFEVVATSSDGDELKVKDSQNEGFFVKTEGNESVVLTVTVKNSDTEVWGLRSIWNNLSK